MGPFYFFIVVAVILIVLFYFFRERHSFNTAPKKIWSYWDNTKIPKTVQMCMQSWAKYNPEYEIVLLNKDTWKGYANIPASIASHPNFNDSPQRFSDLLRLYALAEHGGVWIDSTVLLKEPLENWLFSKPAEFSGFYLGGFSKEENAKSPIIESWFFACNKGSKFVKLWKDEFTEAVQFPNMEKYVESRKKMGVDFEKVADPIYSAIYIAAQKVLQIDKYPLETLILKKAEDGPFKYLVDAKWNSEKALRLACQNKKYQGPLMKMRGPERAVLEEYIDYDLSPEKCGWL